MSEIVELVTDLVSDLNSEQRTLLADIIRPDPDPVAVIGIGCRFPGGANSPEAFWRLLHDGVDAIVEVPPARWNVGELYDPDSAAPGKVSTRWGGFLREDVTGFDAGFFGISPREATFMDPQQRLLLEVAWEALENAGQPIEKLAGSPTGVFMGVCSAEYATHLCSGSLAEVDAYLSTGTAYSIIANRLSYLLDLRGPSLVIDTACSSSLVALHLACQSLQAKECSLALAGGVNLTLFPQGTISFSKWGMMSSDGRCKTFDALADGFVRGEGCGVVVLKRLSEAQAAGDPILAILRSSAINQDGKSAGLTAPNLQAQQAVIRKALAEAGLQPHHISYVEAHGTGTSLGDPIEVEALSNVIGAPTPEQPTCWLGSVKTNIGHLEAAAGVAGLIKVILSLQHRTIPPHLHFRQLNPAISLQGSRFVIPTTPIPWPSLPNAPRRAGISSFGFGGTNAHLIVEEAPAASNQPAREIPQRAWLLPLSARSPAALQALAGAYREYLSQENPPSLPDLCAAASLRRSHLPYRLAVVGASPRELAERLDCASRDVETPGLISGKLPAKGLRRMVWVFPGQGSQWLGMGRELLACEPVFRASIEACAAAFQPHVNWSLLAELQASEEQSHLNQIDVIQPTLFAIQVSLAALWRSWGLEPAAVVGHSMGEVAAAHVAGALSLEQAAQIICQRSQLLRRVSGQGAMAVVERSFEQAQQALQGYEDRLAVAVNNGPRSTVLSGDPQALQAVAEKLKQDGVDVRYVKVDVASHSPQMDGLLDDLAVVLAGLTPRAGQVAFYSTVTNQVCSGAELGADYWVRNLRSPVLFGPAVEQLAKDGHDVFIEISPHPILLPAIDENLRRAGKDAVTFPSLRRGEAELRRMYESLGGLYTQGILPCWAALYPQASPMLPLPNYPWQREPYWFKPQEVTSQQQHSSAGLALLGEHWESAAQTGQHAWKVAIHPALAYLKDHRVQGTVVFPAAGYLDLVLAAARQLWGDGVHPLEQLNLEKVLALHEDTLPEVQLSLKVEMAGKTTFQVSSRLQGGDVWTTHARGSLRRNANLAVETLPIQAIQARCPRSIEAEAHYQIMQKSGLEYGTAFRGVMHIWQGDGEALGRLQRPDGLQTAAHAIHPAFLDACLQVAGHAVAGQVAEGVTYIPVGFEQVVQYGLPAANAWGYAVARSAGETPAVDVFLLDEQGVVALAIHGLKLQRLDAQSGPLAWHNWLYELAWRSQPLPEIASLRIEGNWLLVSDDPVAGAQVAATWKAAGATCVLLPLRESNQQATRLKQVFDSQGCRGIIYWLSDFDTPQAVLEGNVGILTSIQALAQAGWRSAPKIWLVTRGAQAVSEAGRYSTIRPGHTSFWGLGRVITHEHPEWELTQVDLDPADPNAAPTLLAEVAFGLGQPALVEDQVAWRAGQRYVARLERHAPTSQAPGLAPAGERSFQLEMAEPGQLSHLTWRAARRTLPAPGQVEIEVAAASLNFLDVLAAMGVRPDQISSLPLHFGGECAGRVVGVGEGVSGLAVGDEVVALAQTGMGRYAIADANLVAHKPGGLNFAQAAALPIVYMTAHYALRHVARLSPGERVLIHSAAGGTGLAAVHIARFLQAEIYATAGSPEKHAYLHGLGITHVADSRSLAFADQVKTWTAQQGVDVVLNSLSGPAIPASLDTLAPYGRFVEIGKKDIYDQQTLSLSPFRRSLSYTAVDLAGMAAIKPAAFARLFQEVIAAVDSGEYPPLPVRLYPASQVVEAFHHLAQGQNIGKVAVTFEDATAVPVAPERWEGLCDADATYLITGGLGGLGLKTAEWLVAKGARHLVLAGRHAPGPDANAAIEALRQKGVGVEVVAADVSQAEDVEALFALIQRTGRVLKGVIHSAGLLDDGILLKQNAERFAGVFAPKVSGGWLLHQATRACSLDFFVLYSSAASLLGAPGQGNYAAANAFLDGLAWYRQANGLPALSINWGPWSEVGLAAAQANRGERLAQQGMESISPADGLAVLEYLMRQDVAQVGVLPINIRQWRQSNPKAAQVALLRELVEAVAGQAGSAQQDGLVATLRSLSPEQGRERLEEHLRQQLGQVLRLPAERIGSQTPVQALGLDSLMALEFRNRLENSLGLSLPVTLIWGYPTLAALSAHLASKLDLPEANHLVAEQVTTVEQIAESADVFGILDELEQLSADDLNDLLSDFDTSQGKSL